MAGPSKKGPVDGAVRVKIQVQVPPFKENRPEDLKPSSSSRQRSSSKSFSGKGRRRSQLNGHVALTSRLKERGSLITFLLTSTGPSGRPRRIHRRLEPEVVRVPIPSSSDVIPPEWDSPRAEFHRAGSPDRAQIASTAWVLKADEFESSFATLGSACLVSNLTAPFPASLGLHAWFIFVQRSGSTSQRPQWSRC